MTNAEMIAEARIAHAWTEWPHIALRLADALERAEKVIPVAREMRQQEPDHWRAGNHCTQCGFSWPCAWAAFDEALDEYDGGKA